MTWPEVRALVRAWWCRHVWHDYQAVPQEEIRVATRKYANGLCGIDDLPATCCGRCGKRFTFGGAEIER